MAAPMPVLSKQQQNQSIRAKGQQEKKKKKIPNQGKNVLHNPYIENWPFVPTDIEDRVLALLKESMCVQFIPKFASNKERQLYHQQVKDNQLSESQVEERNARLKLRKELAIGVNRVTKSLEKDELRLVIVTREPKVEVLVAHVLPLVRVRNCPAIRLPNLSTNMYPVSGIQSMLCLGFKKTSEKSIFDNFVEYVVKNAPPMVSPWLEEAKFTSETDSDDKSELKALQSEIDTNIHKDTLQTTDSNTQTEIPVSMETSNHKDTLQTTDSNTQTEIPVSMETSNHKDTLQTTYSNTQTEIPVSMETSNHKDTLQTTDSNTQTEIPVSMETSNHKDTLQTTDSNTQTEIPVSMETSNHKDTLQTTDSNTQTEIPVSMETSNSQEQNSESTNGLKKDYSYLYVYKKQGNLGDDFISLSSVTDEDYFPTDAKKTKTDDNVQLLSVRYHGINVKKLKKNEDRKQKKKVK